MPRLSDFHRAAEKRRTNGRAGQRIQLYWQHFKIIQDRFARIMGYRMGGEQRRRIPFDESSSVECVPLVDNGSWAAGRPCFAKSGDSDFSISPRGPRVTKKGINVSTLPGKPIDTPSPKKSLLSPFSSFSVSYFDTFRDRPREYTYICVNLLNRRFDFLF